MISSPCRKCLQQYSPKEVCIKNCEKIKTLQNHLSRMETPPYTHSQTADNSQYTVHLSVTWDA